MRRAQRRQEVLFVGGDRLVSSVISFMKHRVLLVDHHQAIRELIAYFFRDKEFEVAGEAEDGLEALNVCRKALPSLAVIDLELPGLSGIEVVKRIRKEVSPVRIVVFSAVTDSELLSKMLQAEPHGFVRKMDPLQTFLDALRAVMCGRRFFSLGADALFDAGAARKSLRLSPREIEIVQSVAEGKTSRETAARLGIAAKTVQNHRARVMQRLQLHSVAELTRYAIRMGLVDAKS
jgi:DNA-binding NarL/FixJ family response regulator